MKLKSIGAFYITNAVKIVPGYENGRCCLNQMEFASWFKENAYCAKYIIHFDIRIYK